MHWSNLVVIYLICSGLSDFLTKSSNSEKDRFSPYKNAVWTGLMMTAAIPALKGFSETRMAVSLLLFRNPALMLFTLGYAVLFFFGKVILKKQEVLLFSSVKKAAAALPVIIAAFVCTMTGVISGFTLHSCIPYLLCLFTILAGTIVVLCVLKKSPQTVLKTREKKWKTFVFSAGYGFAEASFFIFCGLIFEKYIDLQIGKADLLIIGCSMFAFWGLTAWLYMLLKLNYKYNPFQQGEIQKSWTGLCETAAFLAIVLAIAQNRSFVIAGSSMSFLVVILLDLTFRKKMKWKEESDCCI